jgi:hypothetical protein
MTIMGSKTVHLFKATDAEDAYAIRLAHDDPGKWRAERGFGQNFEEVWSVELQSRKQAPESRVDWDAVLERVIEACTLSDPVITNFQWPVRQAA